MHRIAILTSCNIGCINCNRCYLFLKKIWSCP